MNMLQKPIRSVLGVRILMDLLRIRIQKAKMTHKSKEIVSFEVLDVLFWGIISTDKTAYGLWIMC